MTALIFAGIVAGYLTGVGVAGQLHDRLNGDSDNTEIAAFMWPFYLFIFLGVLIADKIVARSIPKATARAVSAP